MTVGIATLALLEGGLWVLHPLDAEPVRRIHRFLPSYHAMSPAPRVIEFDPGPLPGVTPGIRLVPVNRLGFLYPEQRQARVARDEVRIAAVGGSTTECVALPEEKRWPAVLEQLLGAELPGRPVTVLNLGLSATDTRTHLATMAQHVPGLDVDVAVFLLGANDLSRMSADATPLLSPDNFYSQTSPGRLFAELWRLTQISRHLASWRTAGHAEPATAPYFAEQARLQASLPLMPRPSFSPAGLSDYARAIVSLAGLCREHGITPLFVTQPTMLTHTPSPAEMATIWSANNGVQSVAPGDFVDLLATINRQLLTTCAERGYACVDLAQSIPHGLSHFYDQVHFNEPGARRVAESLLPATREIVAQRSERR